MNWIMLSAGRGPVECQIAVAGLASALVAEAVSIGIIADIIEEQDGEHGPLSCLVSLYGDPKACEKLVQSWVGSVLWTSPSPIRSGVRRKNWFVGVSRIGANEHSSVLDPKDVKYETMRASRPGRQHVNKPESAVRATHMPTGIAVVAREDRSQHRNKSLALARLSDKLESMSDAREAEASPDRRARHDDLERGNSVRHYTGSAFKQIR